MRSHYRTLKRYETPQLKYPAIFGMGFEIISLPPPLNDKAVQDKTFGPFSFQDAVIPLVRNKMEMVVDLRFADALNDGKITPEAAALEEATSNIIMLRPGRLVKSLTLQGETL
jgi:hypothetical protein